MSVFMHGWIDGCRPNSINLCMSIHTDPYIHTYIQNVFLAIYILNKE